MLKHLYCTLSSLVWAAAVGHCILSQTRIFNNIVVQQYIWLQLPMKGRLRLTVLYHHHLLPRPNTVLIRFVTNIFTEDIAFVLVEKRCL